MTPSSLATRYRLVAKPLLLSVLACALLACSKTIDPSFSCLHGDACESDGPRVEPGAGGDDPDSGFSNAPERDASVGAIDASTHALSVHVRDIAGSLVERITLRCAGDCIAVTAVASGGHGPYAFSWDDGSTHATREVCPTESTELSVTVTDTAIDDGEFPYAAHSASTRVAIDARECRDASAQDSDAGILDAGEPIRTIYWVEWTEVSWDGDTSIGSATGTLELPDGRVARINYSGEVRLPSQTGISRTNYFVPEETYLSPTVANLPPTYGMIAVSGEGQQRDAMQYMSFTAAVSDPVVAIQDLGSTDNPSTWEFTVDPIVLSSNVDESGAPLLTASGRRVTGRGGSGVVQLQGHFVVIIFTIPTSEPTPGWGGFTIGVRGAL